MLDIKKLIDPAFERVNKARFEEMYHGMNQNNATVFLAIGIHFNHITKAAFPCIMGSQYLDLDQARKLLQEALVSLDEKIIADQQTPRG